MSRLMSGGISLLLAFIAGVWMIVSPFAMNTQVAGAGWDAATINNVVVGGILVGSALVGIGVALALQVRDRVRASGEQASRTLNQSAA